jgi:hypothetical protein
MANDFPVTSTDGKGSYSLEQLAKHTVNNKAIKLNFSAFNF